MNNDQLLKIADIGLALMPQDDEIELLYILLNIEDILDKGRNLLIETPGAVNEANVRMDELRKRIRSMLDNMDSDTARQFLDERGESLKTQFSLS